jgi:hypothetical protein
LGEGGGQEKWALWQFCPTTEESLKNALEKELPYTLKSPNKQLMHTFFHFVVSSQSRFYTLALVFVFDMNIYSPSLRLFKIHPVVSLLVATNRQYFTLALSLPLRWLRITFVLNTLIALN